MERVRKRRLKNFIDKIRSESSAKNRRNGKIATVIGTACATVLALGLVSNPIGITLLAVGSALFGGKAISHAVKTKEDLNNLDK